MKVKQYLFLTNPDEFSINPDRGNYFLLSLPDMKVGGWIDLGEVELEVDVDMARRLIKDRNNLLAITHGGEE